MLLEQLNKRVLVIDGAMGSLIQSQGLTAADFGGEALDGCNEHLVLTKPDAIAKIHRAYLEAGADIIETDTFGASALVLAEYHLADRAVEMNTAAAALARGCADAFATPDKPRFVGGSIGPGTKLPTLGHTNFQTLVDSYRDQCIGLLRGNVDLLMIETCQDILQIKAAICGAHEAIDATKITRPISVSVTVEQTGTMLIGTDTGAALAAIAPYGIDIIGMNCATGPQEMEEHVRHFCRHAKMPVAVVPNAGLPENVGGEAHYSLTPEEFVKWQLYFVEKFGVALVGGCCGTTPKHIQALAKAMACKVAAPREPQWIPSISSVYTSCALDQEPRPMMIGERSNANGSKKFRELLEAEDWDGIVDMGKDQIREGAHALDICVAYVGRNEISDMAEVVQRYATQVPLPLMIDSTEAPAIERALQLAGGRSIINSINLEDGMTRIEQIVPLAKRYGAAVVALTIDEAGMAKTVEKKVAIAQRIHDICVGQFGLQPEDLIFDPLTFTIGSGDKEFYDAGIQTLKGIAAIKRALPGVRTILGLSNISFGLSPNARVVLNSVYLHEAVEHGLDAAIVHASKILPLNRIPDDVQQLALDLIYNRREHGDPLIIYMGYFDGATVAVGSTEVDDSDDPIATRLQRRIVDGNKKDLTERLDEAMQTHAPLEIINTILLEGMKTVGELFGSGKMQLPFVLQSAEAMKAAVAHLEPHMEKSEGQSRGKIVLATVKGDVHDIGKNLVDIILTNNGFDVVNLGIKISLEQMLQAATEHAADAIGMSGLLVKSTAIMKENLEEMAHRQLAIPVICGGAALTRRFVEGDLSAAYGRTVFYGKDAFAGLHIMQELGAGKIAADPISTPAPSKPRKSAQKTTLAPGTRSAARTDVPIPTPPFWGSKVIEDIPLDRLFAFINSTALYKGQWQFRQGRQSKDEYAALVKKKIEPVFRRLTRQVAKERLFTPQVAYGYFPCQADGDTLIVYEPGTTTAKVRFVFPRQSSDAHKCLADFFRPVSSGEIDVVAFHCVTVGAKAKEVCNKYYADGKYTDYLYMHGLSVETAEALAEYWHKIIRVELGIAGSDATLNADLFKQQYQGSRYSFGYPACPNLEDQEQLFALLEPERIGVTLSETHQMDPEASTSAIICHHPEAKYFSV